jgi:hypothetical protein
MRVRQAILQKIPSVHDVTVSLSTSGKYRSTHLMRPQQQVETDVENAVKSIPEIEGKKILKSKNFMDEICIFF